VGRGHLRGGIPHYVITLTLAAEGALSRRRAEQREKKRERKGKKKKRG